jgi:hypothetical protein
MITRRPFIPFLNGQAASLAATSYSRLRSEADVAEFSDGSQIEPDEEQTISKVI